MILPTLLHLILLITIHSTSSIISPSPLYLPTLYITTLSSTQTTLLPLTKRIYTRNLFVNDLNAKLESINDNAIGEYDYKTLNNDSDDNDEADEEYYKDRLTYRTQLTTALTKTADELIKRNIELLERKITNDFDSAIALTFSSFDGGLNDSTGNSFIDKTKELVEQYVDLYTKILQTSTIKTLSSPTTSELTSTLHKKLTAQIENYAASPVGILLSKGIIQERVDRFSYLDRSYLSQGYNQLQRRIKLNKAKVDAEKKVATTQSADVKKRRLKIQPQLSLVTMLRPSGHGNLQSYFSYVLDSGLLGSFVLGFCNDGDSIEVLNGFGGRRPPLCRMQVKVKVDVDYGKEE